MESDQPQVTVNRRFEVFFPERRPFFPENSDLFSTPIDNLIFTRRIADPQFGVRLTGKAGPYGVGVLLLDDEAPGKSAPAESPSHDERAFFLIARVTRDISQQSRINFLYTQRRFEGASNQVSGLDGRWKLNRNWAAEWQAVGSWSKLADGRMPAGAAYDFELEREGRHFEYTFEYNDRSPDFSAQAGFVPRIDFRRVENSVAYTFRPKNDALLAWGPALSTEKVWDYSGRRLDWSLSPSLEFNLTGQTFFSVFAEAGRQRLRPRDFSVLPAPRDFALKTRGWSFIPRIALSLTAGSFTSNSPA